MTRIGIPSKRGQDEKIQFFKDEPVWICYSSGFQRGWIEHPVEHKEFHEPHALFYFYQVLREDGKRVQTPTRLLMLREIEE